MAEETKKSFSDQLLSKEKREDFLFFKTRILELQEARKDHYGVDLDALWADADKAYIPHRLKSKGKRVVVEDEKKGWRGTLVELGSSNWQSDVSKANPFIKIQTALSILIDQNPSGVFTASSKKYQASTELMRQLYQRSWEFAHSKPQLRLFVFNLAKYGWAIGRTYPLRIARKVKVLKEYNPENPDESVYEEKEVVEFNDIIRENIDPRNAWIDDMARPSNPHSVRDWCWRKVYDFDVAQEEFGKYKLWKYVQPGGNTTEIINETKGATKEPKQSRNLVEVYFYENKIKDLFLVVANGVPVVMEPLPIADAKGIKKLSCWHATWNLRHAESPYGVGINEAIRYDHAMLDRVRNMSLDQLTLSIYKMFFYQGTQALTDTGDIMVAPGVGKQTLDPKNITFLEVPGPGKEAIEWQEMLQKDVDESSGIGDPLLGEVTGKTAFEIAQAKESALKRLKTPLENILEALNNEAYITISLIQLLYSIPETYAIADPILIDDYLKEVEGDPELYERDETGTFVAKVYPEFPLNLEEDDKKNLVETEETKFFRVKPRCLSWEGTISVKAQSLLSPSKQIDKALDLEMWNVVIPLLQTLALEVQLRQQMSQPWKFDDLSVGKTVKSIVKLYDKDPRDIIPDEWLRGMEPQEQPLFVPAGPQQAAPSSPVAPAAPQPQLGSVELPSEPRGIVGKISSGLGNLFR